MIVVTLVVAFYMPNDIIAVATSMFMGCAPRPSCRCSPLAYS